MAVYTDVAFEDLDVLLKAYDIGAARSFKGIAEGIENSNFALDTDRGKFILTLYEKRVSADDLPYFLGLLRHLAARGVPCPVPVPGNDGSESCVLKGRPAAILTWLDGVSLRHPEPGHCASAGRALAQLHDAGSDFPLIRPNALGIDGWRTLAASTLDRADEIEPGLAELITSTLATLDEEWPEALPRGVIHADLFPDNVLFMDDEVSGLIDFYFACNDCLAYDLAVMLNAWCFEDDGLYSAAKGHALMSAYCTHRALEAEELSALPLLATGAALRFLLTRLHDWLTPDPLALVRPKDPREFSQRLRFHRGIKSVAEYGL